MAFRWFRKNKNTTRWLYILVTVFVMVTFTVTGAMLQGLSDESAEALAGSFVTPKGEKVALTAGEFRQLSYKMSRLFGGRNMDEKQVWQTVMLDARAKETGIEVSERMLKAYIRQSVPFQSDEQFRGWLQQIGLAPAEFETLMRQQLRVGLYRDLNRDEPRVLSEKVFEQFQEGNELIRLEYVAFADEAEASQLDGSSVSEEDLRKFYEEELDSSRKEDDFSSEERYGVEAALLAMDQVQVDALRQFLPAARQTLTEEEIKSFYDANLHRYEVAEEEAGGGEEGAEPAGDEPAGDEVSGDEPSGGEADDAGHKHCPLEEVRESIEKELLLGRVITEAMTNYGEMKAAREKASLEQEKQLEEEKKAEAAKAAAAEGEKPEGEAAEGEEEKPVEKAEGDLLAIIAEKYGMELVDFGEPVVLEEIEKLDRIGSALLPGLVQYLPEGNVIPRGPTAETPYGFLLRLNKKVPAKPLPFEEVRDRLPEVWVEITASKRAEEKAEAFDEALKTAARSAVEEAVAAIEKEARDKAAEKIAADGVTEEEAKQASIDAELKARQAEIDDLILPQKGGVFAQVAADQGAEVKTVDWFRETYSRTQFFRDEEKSPEHTLKGRLELFQMEEGQEEVAGPIRDGDNKLYLVARIAGRKKPELTEMKLYDRKQAETFVRQMLNPAEMFSGFNTQMFADQRFEYPELAREMQLVITEPVAPKRDRDRSPDPAPGPDEW
ncbi:MAG: SurA N-terminal domain-containing protein [Planctomycetota bacterium]